MNKLFGTDGIRAEAGHFPLDDDSIYTLGKALIKLLQEEDFFPRVLVGKDPRNSSPKIERVMCRGIKDGGGDFISVGIIPTSAVSLLTKKHSFSAGIMISASHNPYQDNGIKIFSSQGTKISEAWEKILEDHIRKSREKVKGKKLNIIPDFHLSQEYAQFLKNRFRGTSFYPFKIVVDCSNGVSSFFAPEIFSDLGFYVIPIHCSPNGKNINAGCGSLYPQNLAQKVMDEKADLGIAYDGDADRALWVEENGRILNGDYTLYTLSHYMKEKKLLKSEYVVGTIMTNLGLEKALKKIGLKLSRTQVGDKYVREQMIRLGANLGGEQSGHTILSDECPTGDGLLTSIKMLEVMVSKESSLSTLVSDFKEHPQYSTNVRVKKRENFNLYPKIISTLNQINDSLGHSGRIIVRYSGTEPVARIMVEGTNQRQIKDQAESMAYVIAEHLGSKSSK
ncbi:phosphoglucosamine mutase [bacterium]|nr:phosphoglucosamine mutase [bacterium]